MEQLINALIQQANLIYKMYQKIKEDPEPDNFLLLNHLIERENKTIQELENTYPSALSTIEAHLFSLGDFKGDDLIENYIQCSASILPFLRVYLKVNPLIVPDSTEKEENSAINTINNDEDEEEKEEVDEEDLALNIMSEDIKKEMVLNFLKTCYKKYLKNETGNRNKKEQEILEQCIFDMIYLNSFLEEQFLKDGSIYMIPELFSTYIKYEEIFDPELVMKVIHTYHYDTMMKMFHKLQMPRWNRTKKMRIVRSLYLSSLFESLPLTKQREFLENTKEELGQIAHPTAFVQELKRKIKRLETTSMDVGNENH